MAGRFLLSHEIGSRRILDSPIKISMCTVFKHFCFSLKPVLQLLSFYLTTGLIELAGARAYLPLHGSHHERPLLFSACFDIQESPSRLKCLDPASSMITREG